jgi:hypothetical protein
MASRQMANGGSAVPAAACVALRARWHAQPGLSCSVVRTREARRRRAAATSQDVAADGEQAAVGPLRELQAMLDAPPMDHLTEDEGQQWKARLQQLLTVGTDASPQGLGLPGPLASLP